MRTSSVSPTMSYIKLLTRQYRSLGVSVSALWIHDGSESFLYAASGDNCDRLRGSLYEDCAAAVRKTIQSGSPRACSVEEYGAFLIPILCGNACVLLLKGGGGDFDSKQKALAVQSSEELELCLSGAALSRPVSSFAQSRLTLRNIVKVYGTGEGAVRALDGVNLSIREGELLVILGESGSGKSTLLNIIGGMTRPAEGNIMLDGVDLARADTSVLTAYRRDMIGFVFQFYNLVGDLRAAENVAVSAGLVKDALPVGEALRRVGMETKGDRYPGQLSGGEQQRVAIARAIVKRPKLLLCDEPTGALDADSGKRILRLIGELVREGGRTVIIVTHSAAIAAMADRVVRLRSGRIVEEYFNVCKLSADDDDW